MFSIIIPTYNRENHLPKAIESVLSQSFTDWELIIVDDGSTDNTSDVVASYNDPRIKYIYQENAERSAARNNGIRNAKGEWICFLDSDDVYLNQHLAVFEKAIHESANPRFLLSGCIREEAGEENLYPLIDLNKNIIEEIWTCFILANAVCIHRSILLNHQFDLRFRIWEDTHLWTRLSVHYELQVLKDYTCKQIINPEGTVASGLSKVKILDVKQYLAAINDVYQDEAVKKRISHDFYLAYLEQKLRMYLYQSRMNGQLGVALRIWFSYLTSFPRWFLVLEFPKIFLNTLGIKKMNP